MPKRNPQVTEYIQGCAPFARPIFRYLRKVIHEGAPGLEEVIKWGMPSFVYQSKIVCGFAGFKAHCAVWFWKGEAIVDRKSKDAMGNFGRITSLSDLPSEKELTGFVAAAVARIREQA